MTEQDESRVDLNRTWEFGLDGSSLKQVAADEAFCAIVPLCRLLNMLRFATFAVWGLEGSNSPFARRQTLTSFSLSCALLYSAYTQVVPDLVKHYRNLPEYRDGLGKWLADPEVQSLVIDHCKPFRDTATFHFDVGPVGERLLRLKEEWTRVMTGRGTMKGFNYYDLADINALMAFWGDVESASDLNARVVELTKRTSKATKALQEAAHDLIRFVISKPPFQLKQGEDTEEPAWVTFQQKREGTIPPEDRPPLLVKPE